VDPILNPAPLHTAEKLQGRKHIQSCADDGIDFALLVFDTFGGWIPGVTSD
jgi:hypothetical protein